MNSRTRAKLRERAQRLARRDQLAQKRELALEVAVVVLGDDLLGIPVDHLREISKMPALTPIPSVPGHFLGLVQIRGELISVVGLSSLLGLAASSDQKLLVLVERSGRTLGLAVDGLRELRQVYRDELTEDFEAVASSDSLLRGTTGDLLPILDSDKLLDDERITVVGADTSSLKAGNSATLSEPATVSKEK